VASAAGVAASSVQRAGRSAKVVVPWTGSSNFDKTIDRNARQHLLHVCIPDLASPMFLFFIKRGKIFLIKKWR
jgi:hypothetical protein